MPEKLPLVALKEGEEAGAVPKGPVELDAVIGEASEEEEAEIFPARGMLEML